jgi:hypothetical protein
MKSSRLLDEMKDLHKAKVDTRTAEKTGETLAAPARKGWEETTLDITDAEENTMTPSQLRN